MGVHGLWDLLAPVGRRVSVETLAGKKLAIDASIWMIQFMKAMRDEKGDMVRNAHILGFFRRICKLLFLRTKPVFVFDGGTPALKRRTVIARRRQRENAQAKIRKTAEKLLLNHLRTMRAKELAADLQRQRQENDAKGKRPIIQESTSLQNAVKGNDAGVSYSQEQLDEMLAASLAVEENGGSTIDSSTSGAVAPDGEMFRDGEEDDEEDEEIILPEMHGRVDPTVLAALPPSLQLDLLVQMRERLMAENRQKYQKVKKAPAKFSELQIQAYLKTVAFRREIDVVQKSAAGRGIGGVQTSRIASEANREFIFSSSFAGDKQALTSVGQGKVGADQSEPQAVNLPTMSGNEVVQTKKSGNAAGSADVEAGEAFPDDVETYLDDRGQLRVSRLRALGIRMTRDLQRNLDLMKEADLEKSSECTNPGTLVDIQDNSCDRSLHQEITENHDDGMNDKVEKTKDSAALNGTSIEISFEDIVEHEPNNGDDDLFACLVAGDPVVDFSVDKSATGNQSLHTDSDIEWEEGDVIEKRMTNIMKGRTNDEGEVQWEKGFVDNQKCSSCPDENKKALTEGALQEVDSGKQSLNSGSDVEWEEGGVMEKRTINTFERGMNDTENVEWVEGFQDIHKSSLFPDESKKSVTKGALEEEADLQEAIKRSLEDMKDCRSMTDIHEDHISKRDQDIVGEHEGWISEGKEGPEVESPAIDACQPFGSMNILETNFSEVNTAAIVDLNPDKSNLDLKILNQDAGGSRALAGKVLVTPNAQPEDKGLCITRKQPKDVCSEDNNGQAVNKQVDTCSREVAHDSCGFGLSSSFTDSLPGRVFDSGSDDARSMFPGTLSHSSCNTTELGNISADDSLADADGVKELAKEELHDSVSMEQEEPVRSSAFLDDIQEHESMKDHLEEEMVFLDKEREDLGIEQRKLERNAESVSSEMFAECQELLQMFGLPYIIAPMEAEAQCAFMEMSNLVDGVVTDDSDAFLFGAQSVYKNIFDDRKYVETYLMKDIENELGLDRDKLIRMALLLGSDYTEGVSGIGIVNAIEVVNAFPEKDGLFKFREWIESPDPSILGKLDAEPGSNSRRKGSKRSENNMNSSSSKTGGDACDQNVAETADDGLRIKHVFMDKHRNVSKNWHIPSNFPSDAVVSAYASPQVDKSTEPFAWGKPDLHVLRKLCWDKFGWATTKADELLLPVLKEYNKHETQLRLEAFYSFNERFAKIRSKRIKKAVKGMAGAKSFELMDETRSQKSGSGKKRKVKHNEDDVVQSGACSTVLNGAGTTDQNNAVEEQTLRKLKGGRVSRGSLEQPMNVDNNLETGIESGRRGNRGKGRGQRGGTVRWKRNSSSASNEPTYNEGSSSERDEEIQSDKTEKSREVRRSGRVRNSVNYSVSDESDSQDKENENSLKEGLMVEDLCMDQAIGGIDEKNDGNELCMEETEQAYTMDKTTIDQINDSQIDDSLNENLLSKDYLRCGGGFCMEEEDEQIEIEPLDSNVPESADHEVKETHEIDPSVIAPSPSIRKQTRISNPELNLHNNAPNDDFSLDDDSEDNSGNGIRKSLRAIPNLRKKRKT